MLAKTCLTSGGWLFNNGSFVCRLQFVPPLLCGRAVLVLA